MRKSVIAAVDQEWLVGADGNMPWHLPADMKLFRCLTMGKPIIMGRKTFESLGRPLKGRDNIVMTTRPDFTADGVKVVHSLAAAFAAAEELKAEECMVIGGANVYEQALWEADRLYLSYIHHTFDVRLKRDRVYFPRAAWWKHRRADIVRTIRHEIGPESPYVWTFSVSDIVSEDAPRRPSREPSFSAVVVT